ncbi:hypothetical protein GIB67_020578 [Kingdonia uniflora]|uniref:adenylate kinase n=1 Tax=Kingdonia uniflora TaxID=39325 RepID=A0A7J7NVB1_9MAGN|nr:hypothetical protein GIB67_020578 [Kingdonia uniflora]
MAMATSFSLTATAKPTPRNTLISHSSTKPITLFTSSSSSPSPYVPLVLQHRRSSAIELRAKPSFATPVNVEAVKTKENPLRIMISGAPASGKGTQCELITKKYGLVHIAAGDLLRAEVAAESENGKRAKEYMEKGMLVPDEIVVMMVKERLFQSDSQENGWLLDGYPRSSSQAKALEDFGIRPDLFILLDVPEEILVERVAGRRLDPVTGRIYHLKYSPPETEEIATRLTQRFDDTEEKACSDQYTQLHNNLYQSPKLRELYICYLLTIYFILTRDLFLLSFILMLAKAYRLSANLKFLISLFFFAFFRHIVRAKEGQDAGVVALAERDALTLEGSARLPLPSFKHFVFSLGGGYAVGSPFDVGSRTLEVNGNVSKEVVFAKIDTALTGLVEQKSYTSASVGATAV